MTNIQNITTEKSIKIKTKNKQIKYEQNYNSILAIPKKHWHTRHEQWISDESEPVVTHHFVLQLLLDQIQHRLWRHKSNRQMDTDAKHRMLTIQSYSH